MRLICPSCGSDMIKMPVQECDDKSCECEFKFVCMNCGNIIKRE